MYNVIKSIKGDSMDNNRIYLLPKGNYYKANLHCHTTISDGDFSPEKIKQEYMKKGYSIVAFSDHEVLRPHPELESEDFVPLTAIEIGLSDPLNEWPKNKTHHINFISKDKAKDAFIDFSREYSTNNAGKIIREANTAGFLSVYNHPRWSMQSDTGFINLWGILGIEVFNTNTDNLLFNGESEFEYDAFLRAGGLCAPIATDDTHTKEDMFGGFQLIHCDELNYENVISSLEKGNHYASMGPLIKDLYIEDNKLHIACTPCMRIAILTETRNRTFKESKELVDEFTELTLPLPKFDKFIRIYLIDSHGNKALTRAYLKGVDL